MNVIKKGIPDNIGTFIVLGLISLLTLSGWQCNNEIEHRIKEANQLLEAGDFLGARKVYQCVVDKYPRNFSAQYGLGMSWCAETIYKTEIGLAKPEDWFPAIYHITMAMNIQENDQILQTQAILHFNLGTCFKKQNDVENAIKLMEQALIYDSSLLKALNLLGAMYHEQGNYKVAEQYYMKTIAVQPNYSMAYFNLGALAWAQKEYGRAASFFQQASSLEPANPLFKEWLGNAKNFTGNE